MSYDRTNTLTIVTESGSVYVLTTAAPTDLTYDIHIVKGGGGYYEPGTTHKEVTVITPRIGERCHITGMGNDFSLLTSPVAHILRTDIFGTRLPADPYASPSISLDEVDVAAAEAMSNN